MFITAAASQDGICQWGAWVQSIFLSDYSLFPSGSNLFAGVSDGIMLSTDHGVTWTTVITGVNRTYVSCFASSGTTIYAGTADSGIIRSTDNGTSWTRTNNGLQNGSVNTLAINDTNIFAGTYGGVFRSTNKGTDWTSVNFGLSSLSVSALVTAGPNLIAGTLGGGLFLSTNNGTSWKGVHNEIPNTSAYALAQSGTNLFASTDNGVLLSVDSGKNWKFVNTDLIFINSFFPMGTKLFAGSNESDGIVYLSADSGVSWTEVTQGEPHRVVTVAVSGPNLIAGSYNTGIWYCPLSKLQNSVDRPRQPDLRISFSPNPTTGMISIHGAPEDLIHVTISNLLGETVLEFPHPNAPDFTLDLSKLPPGTYFVRFSLPNEVVTRKIMKQ